ncbi:Fc.00g059120.m01.CDS01 [Cosmosporella sp. VM-42]
MPIACTPPPPDTPNRQYGINDTQERDLKSKKRAGTHKTEEDKWRDVYKICFPDDEPIPDPYQEYPHETRLMTKYQDFLAREIPTHVRRRLQGLPTTLSESDLRNQIPQMVSELVNQLYHSFRNQITQQRAEAAPAVHAQSIGSNGYLASVTGTQVSLEMPTGSALQPSWEQNLANGHEDASSEWDEIFNWEFDL